MINKLTDELTAKLSLYRDKWISIGLSTEPTNKERATSVVPSFYAAGGLPPPKIVMFATSPFAAMKIISVLSNDKFWSSVSKLTKNPDDVVAAVAAIVNNEPVPMMSEKLDAAVRSGVQNTPTTWNGNFSGGNLWAGWQGFYEFFDKELGIKGLEIIRPTCALSQDVGWIFPYENLCLMVQKPTEIHLNAGGRLHNEHGMAIKWSDGKGIYSLNGVQVPAWSMETPKDNIQPEKILGLASTEQRMALMKYIGLAKFLKDLKAEVIDENNGDKLYYIIVEGQKIGPYLYLKCPSSGREFLEGCGDPDKNEFIDPTIKTCEEAHKWRAQKASKNFMTKFLNPKKWQYHA